MKPTPTTFLPGGLFPGFVLVLTCCLLQCAAAQAPSSASAGTLTSSGLRYESLHAGKGPRPSADDVVRVNYRGTFLDGREFDSSYKYGRPIEFPLSRVIRCWTEGVQLMQVGETARLTCPPEIAYGANGAGGGAIPPNTTLQFEIELLAIVPKH